MKSITWTWKLSTELRNERCFHRLKRIKAEEKEVESKLQSECSKTYVSMKIHYGVDSNLKLIPGRLR